MYAKKHTGLPSLSYNDAVEEALCFGWIDSLMNPIDGDFYMQLFTPRKATSSWSALNRTRVARLIESGQMTPAGKKLIDVAKKRGTWTALAHVEELQEPPELRRALNANAAAKKNWPACTPGRRKMFLYWLNDAKRAETRAARIAKIVDMVARKVSPSM